MSAELDNNSNNNNTSRREEVEGEEKSRYSPGNGNNNVDTNDNTMKLSPEVVTRLHQLQDANRPVSIDEILQAANLSHLAVNQQQLKPSKSADNRLLSTQPEQVDIVPTKSASMTLAERRRIPASTEKLRLCAQITQSSTVDSSCPQPTQQEENNSKNKLLEKYENENDELPPEVNFLFFSVTTLYLRNSPGRALLFSIATPRNSSPRATPFSLSFFLSPIMLEFHIYSYNQYEYNVYYDPGRKKRL